MSQPWGPSGLERGRGCGPFVASARSERAAGVRSADSQSAVPKAWTPHRLIKSEDTITHSPNRERKKASTAHSVNGWHLNHSGPPEAGPPPD